MSDTIHSILVEERRFAPSTEFQARARLRDPAEYERLHQQSISDPEAFWGEQAQKLIPWMQPFTQVLDWQLPFSKWFADGRTNASVVCLDQHLSGPRRNKAALIWEGEPGDTRTLTYGQLHREVCRWPMC